MSPETLIAPARPPGVEGFVIAPDLLTAARPKSTRNQTVQYGAGYGMFAAGRVLRDLAVARILGPSRFGMWGALLVYRQYSNYTDFGFTNGLGRVLPRLVQEGNPPDARRAMSAAWLVAGLCAGYRFKVLRIVPLV